MARPGRPERNRAARSFRQLSRFDHFINSDRVFSTHNGRSRLASDRSDHALSEEPQFDVTRLRCIRRRRRDERTLPAGKLYRQQHDADENIYAAADVGPHNRLMPSFEPGAAGADPVEMVSDLGAQQPTYQPADSWTAMSMAGRLRAR